ncbi:DUF4376 domain-containing protein [Chitiniphilus shinanonensis]|uniref:DUF4376 domain-containing protein n=1 Tax=Chitiniphilus shinanonensis TaxID=553088 RepID=UPI00302C1C2A
MYRVIGECVVRLLDGASIPADPDNYDYQNYLAWVAAGNTPLPAAGPDRDQVNARINTWRTQMEAAGFPALGRWWDSDDMARERLTLTLLAGQGSPVGYWKDVENHQVAPGDAAMIATLYAAMVEYGAAIFARTEQMKTEVAALPDAQLAEYQIGWPPAG